MDGGSRLWDASGELILDTSSFTYQVIFTTIVDFRAATGPQSFTYQVPDYDPAKCCVVMLPLDDFRNSFGEYWNSSPYIKQSELVAGSVTVYNYRPEYYGKSVGGSHPYDYYTNTRITLMVLRFA